MKLFGKVFTNKAEALEAIQAWQIETKQPDSELKNIYICDLNCYQSFPEQENKVLVSYNSYLTDSENTTAYFELFIQKFTDKEEDEYTAMEYDGVMGQLFSIEVGEYLLETQHIMQDKNRVLCRIKEAVEELKKKPTVKKLKVKK